MYYFYLKSTKISDEAQIISKSAGVQPGTKDWVQFHTCIHSKTSKFLQSTYTRIAWRNRDRLGTLRTKKRFRGAFQQKFMKENSCSRSGQIAKGDIVLP
jgi:hypothetical protein